MIIDTQTRIKHWQGTIASRGNDIFHDELEMAAQANDHHHHLRADLRSTCL